MSRQIGDRSEEIASVYLQGNGLKVVTRNFRSPRGELDIVMEDGETLVFVEVRFRRNQRFGSGAESVDRHKQQRLITSAAYYLQKNHQYSNRPTRFDVVSISMEANQPSIDWIQDAFIT